VTGAGLELPRAPGIAALQAFMSALCRDAYACDWADHLEYVLWYALAQGPMTFGRSELDARRLAELRRLADACGAWVTREADGSFRAMPFAAWQDRFASNFELLRMDAPVPPSGGLP
jgi:hypothetical protein